MDDLQSNEHCENRKVVTQSGDHSSSANKKHADDRSDKKKQLQNELLSRSKKSSGSSNGDLKTKNRLQKHPTSSSNDTAAGTGTTTKSHNATKSITSSNNKKMNRGNEGNDDPYDLYERFVTNHKLFFRSALVEIRQGYKRGCWLWFLLPTAPYIVNGIERGSSMNRHFCLRGDDCVKAYLEFERDEVNLRTNYLKLIQAVRMQLQGGNTLSHIFGPMDDVKVISSLTLFERIAKDMKDDELSRVCRSVLELSNKRISRISKQRTQSV